MSNWFRTPKQKLYAAFFGLMMVLFGVLTVASLGDGTPVWTSDFLESSFEQESADASQVGTFSLESKELCMLKVEGLTLDQSWLWVKVMILDEQERPVYDYTFNLSHYSGVEGGESWSEGDQDDYKVFVLPKGDYKVLVYGEDENPGSSASPSAPMYSTGYTTIDRDETIRVTLTRDVLLTRYFLTLLILFTVLFIGYVWLRSERSKNEVPAYYDYGQGGQDPNYYTPPMATGGPTMGVGAPSGGAYDLTDQAHTEGFDPDIDPHQKG